MNRRMNYLCMLVMAIVAMAMPSCSDEDVILMDIFPTSIEIEIRDASGNDLLNPEIQGNIVGEDVSMEYDGKKYDAEWNSGEYEGPRVPWPTFFGLKHRSQNNKNWAFQLGEFPGGENYDITIPLKCKGHVFNIRIVHNFKMSNKVENIKSEIKVYLDGKECESTYVKIVL